VSLSRPRARALAAACAATTSAIVALPATTSGEPLPAALQPGAIGPAGPLPPPLQPKPAAAPLTAEALQDLIDRSRRRALRARETRAPQRRLRLSADGRAIVPDGAPRTIRRLIKAANRIAHKPYVWGGGHGSWQAAGYDCSGSVGYVLHAAGVLDHAVTSGDLASYGRPGRGRWVTVYANGGHTYMVVAGVRFDTTAYKHGGSRWARDARGGAGYVVRHPAGL